MQNQNTLKYNLFFLYYLIGISYTLIYQCCKKIIAFQKLPLFRHVDVLP